MNKRQHSASRGASALLQIVASVLAGLASCSPFALAQDSPYHSETPICLDSATEPSSNSIWRPWRVLWNHKTGADRYRSGCPICRRNHQCPLPVSTPVCEPNFGYHQPCWRQIPVDRRCETFESYQSIEFYQNNSVSESPPIAPEPLPPVYPLLRDRGVMAGTEAAKRGPSPPVYPILRDSRLRSR